MLGGGGGSHLPLHSSWRSPQLYFPEEHKLAVYVPFFLPLSMTLVLGCIHRLKQLKKSPKEDSVEQQQGDDQPGDGDPDAQVDEQ